MTHGNLVWAKTHISTYAGKYQLFKNYYYGNHVIRLSDQIQKSFEMLLGFTRDNLCPLVVDTLADRLTLTGFDTDDESAAKLLNLWWTDLKMTSRSGKIHFDAGMRGDAYVIVWPDEDNDNLPRIYPQKPANIAVRYEDNGQEEEIVEAVKVWVAKHPLDADKDILRITRYLPNQVERYYSEAAGVGIPNDTSDTNLKFYEFDANEPAVFDHPFGVPVFRFCNSMDPEIFAYSELTDVIPHIDVMNKTLADLVVAEEFHGLPQRWATGLTKPRDPNTGKEIQPFKSGGDRIWTVGDSEVKFGEFAAADLKQFTDLLNDERLEVARISRTPLHLMLLNTGNFPSGEALRTAEAPLISKIKKRQTYYGEIWSAIMELCLQIAGINSESEITPQWVDASPTSETDKLNGLVLKKNIGVTPSQLQAEAGYTSDQIVAMQSENDAAAASMAERAAATFNAGRGL